MQKDFEDHIKIFLPLISQVRQHMRKLLWSFSTKRLQRIHRNNPWRDGGGKVLGEKRTQRHVLPLLNIACGPVIEQNKSCDIVFGLGGVYRMTELCFSAGDKRYFKLEVELSCRGENR